MLGSTNLDRLVILQQYLHFEDKVLFPAEKSVVHFYMFLNEFQYRVSRGGRFMSTISFVLHLCIPKAVQFYKETQFSVLLNLTLM